MRGRVLEGQRGAEHGGQHEHDDHDADEHAEAAALLDGAAVRVELVVVVAVRVAELGAALARPRADRGPVAVAAGIDPPLARTGPGLLVRLVRLDLAELVRRPQLLQRPVQLLDLPASMRSVSMAPTPLTGPRTARAG